MSNRRSYSESGEGTSILRLKCGKAALLLPSLEMETTQKQAIETQPRFELIEEPAYADYVHPDARAIHLDLIPYLLPIPVAKRRSIISDINRLFQPGREFNCRVFFSEGRHQIEFITVPPLLKEDIFYITDIVRHSLHTSCEQTETT